MRITLNSEETKTLIENYYARKNDKVSVKFKSSIRSEGYYGNEVGYGEIILSRKVEILEIKTKAEEVLSRDVVLGIFNEALKSQGFAVTDLTYDVGINPGGSYIWESSTPSAYFSGIELQVEKVKNVAMKLSI